MPFKHFGELVSLKLSGPFVKTNYKTLRLKLALILATYFWTSLTDIAKEGEWIWQSTNASVTSYINWLPGQPDNYAGDQDCMRLNWGTTLQWDDWACSGQLEGICEQHP